MDCVEVCPVDCFYEGENMLVINPNECIDCGVCEPECPAEAILPDTENGLEKWLELNTKFSAEWPNIPVKGDAPADADDMKCVENTFEQFFSTEPGAGSRTEEHTSELQSLMRNSYAVFCLKQENNNNLVPRSSLE